MQVSGKTGLIALLVGSSPKLAERRNASPIDIWNSPPGFYELWNPGICLALDPARAEPVLAGHFATALTSANLHARRADVLSRSGPEIIS